LTTDPSELPPAYLAVHTCPELITSLPWNIHKSPTRAKKCDKPRNAEFSAPS